MEVEIAALGSVGWLVPGATSDAPSALAPEETASVDVGSDRLKNEIENRRANMTRSPAATR
jgi:hypothetical protein